MKKHTRERVVPTISARVCCDIFGMYCSGSSGLPNSVIIRSIRAMRFSLELKKLIDQIGLNAHASFQNDLQKEVRTTMLHMHSISPGIAELLLSTSIPCGLRRRTSQSNFTAGFLRRRDNLFKFAHFSRDTSSTFGSHDRKLSMMNLVGNPTTEAIAIRASSR